MAGILADNNTEGQVAYLLHRLESAQWQEIWLSLNLPVVRFVDLGLARNITDAMLWQVCQQRQILLITRNRNAAGPDSLEATIRTHNTPSSLPVFTLANADRIDRDRAYAERIVERLLEYLIDLDNYRGTGRIYLP